MTTVNQKAPAVDERVYARDLRPGQWVVRADTNGASPMRVLFRSDPDDQAAQIVAVFKGGHYSFSETFTQDTVFNVATADQVAAFEETARRMLIGTQLRRLADLIERNASLPLGRYPSITFAHDLSEDDLTMVARIVGAEVTNSYGKRHEVRFGSYDGFQAEWAGSWDDKPDPVETAKADAAELIDEATGPRLDHPFQNARGGKTCSKSIPSGDDNIRCGLRREDHPAGGQDNANTRPAGADQ